MAKHTLYIITYDRGKYPLSGKTKPYHWSYFIQIQVTNNTNTGIQHQLHGMPGSFHYDGPEDVDLKKWEVAPKEEVEIGEVDSLKLDKVHEILKSVSIDTVESCGWNCQDWSLDGFEKLQKEGFVYDYLTKDGLRNWLRED